MNKRRRLFLLTVLLAGLSASVPMCLAHGPSYPPDPWLGQCPCPTPITYPCPWCN